MTPIRKLVVFHTAFIGDIVLTIPLLQYLREAFPGAEILAVTTPAAAGLLRGHPAVSRVIEFDKRGVARGMRGVLSIAHVLRGERIDVAVIPHRSLRSGVVCWLARIPVRIGFDTSSGRVLLTHKVQYQKKAHEIDRNLSLTRPLGHQPARILPRLYPSAEDARVVDELLRHYENVASAGGREQMIAIAPGSVWETKRWPEERFAELARCFAADGWTIVLIGGEADVPLCGRIASTAGTQFIDASGRLTLLQSAELIRRCAVLVSNDSAPMHLAVGVDTPVVAIFGATIPGFGFAPAGPRDRVVETPGLDCRPCSIHGGTRCPIRTFVCMRNISAEQLMTEVRALVRAPFGVRAR
ncbi:MAG: lipopolysaccharide heptosyltransferase II [Bacteroidota bacterium]